MRKFFAPLVVMFLLLVCFAMPAQATVGPVVWEVRVLVDDETFELWHIWDEMFAPSFRLQDIAYILNGTSAQFDIREPNDDRIDYWIIRGEPYTPIGNEFRPIGYDDDDWVWFGGYLNRVVIGVDGIDTPETVVSLTVWSDEHGTYAGIWDLEHLLGFSLDWSDFGYSWLLIHDYFIEGADFVISTDTRLSAELPVQSIEFMELMANLAGNWVDIEHFYSPIIDESVIWPLELYFSRDGHGVRDGGWGSVAPIQRSSALWTGWWYTLSMHNLEDGHVELIVASQAERAWNAPIANVSDEETVQYVYEHRILVDTSQEQIGEILYYIGDTQHHMVRVPGWRWEPRFNYPEQYITPRDARRYYAEPYEDGGIRLLYVLGSRALSADFMVYRSLVYGERGTRIFLQEELSRYDRILFEFVDTTVQRGNVYYYSLWHISWGFERNIPITKQAWQMRVDVDAVFDGLEVAEIEVPEDEAVEEVGEVYIPAAEETPDRFNYHVLWFFSLIAVAMTIIFNYKNY